MLADDLGSRSGESVGDGSLARVRTFLSAVVVLIAMVAMVVALPSLWMKERLVDPEGFVTTVQPAAQDQRVKDFIAEQITAEVGARTGSDAAQALVEPGAREYTNSPEFEADFTEVVSQQHSWLFEEADPNAPAESMSLDISSMVENVINANGVPVDIAGPILVPIGDGGTGLEAGRYHQLGQQITAMALVATGVAVVASVLALLIGRSRGTVLAWLGIGLLLSAAGAWLISRVFARVATDEASAADATGREVAEVIVNGAADNLLGVAGAVALVGAVVVVVGIVWRVVMPPRRAGY